MDDIDDGVTRTSNAILGLDYTEQGTSDLKLPAEITDEQEDAIWDALTALERPVINPDDIAP